MLVSVLLHAAAAGAFVLAPQPTPLGGGTTLDAISVALVDARDIDTAQIAQAAAGQAPSAEAVASTGVPTPSTQPPQQREQRDEPPRPPIETAAREREEVPQATPEPALLPAVETPASTPASKPEQPAAPEQPATTAPPTVASAPSDAIASAPPVDATTPAASADTSTPGANSADVERFARGVALALGKSRPRGVGQKGRVDIEFTIAADGRSLERARIVRSSGVTRLDTMAEHAVARASFPHPPPSFTVAQRTFRVPFHFD